MTIQIDVLEMRLAQAVTRAQQMMLAAPPAAGSGMVDDGLQAELRRMLLRQFGDLQRRHEAMAAAVAIASPAQRGQEQARIETFDDGLSRLCRCAARLASLLATLRNRAGAASGVQVSWAQSVQRLGAEAGKPLDASLVRRTVQQVTTQPVHLAAGPAGGLPGALLDSLFIVMALAAALLQAGGRDR
jgi:hypothetical protein